MKLGIEPRFPLGQIVYTPGAMDALEQANIHPLALVGRHAKGDWGTLCEDDAEENELSVKEGYRILSSYEIQPGTEVWVITEADRSVTTLLLPSEY